jgi:WD40 repeat protein
VISSTPFLRSGIPIIGSTLILFVVGIVGMAQTDDSPRFRSHFSVRGDEATATALNIDGKRALLASKSGLMTIFDPTPGKLITIFPWEAHKKNVTALDFSKDDAMFVSASMDGMVKVWDTISAYQYQQDSFEKKENPASKPLPLKSFQAHVSGVTWVHFHPEGKKVATSGADGAIKVWAIDSTPKQLMVLTGHKGAVNMVRFSPDGKWIASAGADKSVRIWKVDDVAEVVQNLANHSGPVTSVDFSPDGKRVATGTGVAKKSGEVKVWDIATGKELLLLKGHTDIVTGVAFHPEGKRLVSVGKDKQVRTWEVETAKELFVDSHGGEVRSVCFSRNGDLLGTIDHVEGKWWLGNPPMK